MEKHEDNNGEVGPKEMHARIKAGTFSGLILDVREPAEFEIVHLDHAHLIPLRELPGRLNEIAEYRANEIVVYCHHGMRSQQAIQYLWTQGFSTLKNLSGGIDAWARVVDSKMTRY